MSLTGHLSAGALARFFTAECPGTRKLCGEIAALQADRRPIGPHRGGVGGDYWAAVGGAFGQRLAFFVQPAPPYYALLGAARIASLGWTDLAHRRFPTHAALPADGTALWKRPLPGGSWLRLPGSPVRYEPFDAAETELDKFIVRVVDCLRAEAPPGTVGSSPVETAIARCCWLFDGWEGGYRTGVLGPEYRTDDVLDRAPRDMVGELVHLIDGFRDGAALADFRRLAGEPPAGQPLGTAAPVFVPHWADGDLVVGTTLVDVKTVMTVRNADRTSRWLWQLLSYAWLDVADRYRIRRLGLYLARHAALVSWPLPTFAATLLGGADRIDPVRRRFLDLARAAIRDDGADSAWITAVVGADNDLWVS